MIDFARENDKIIVTKLDRLSRNSLELQKTAQELENKKIDLIVLEQSIDTSTPSGKLLFNIISVVVEFERQMINERTANGRKLAMKKGIKFGKKDALSDEEKLEVAKLISDGKTKVELAKRFNVGRATIYRVLREVKK